MFLSGEVCSSASPALVGGAILSARTGLMGQKSAEVIVPAMEFTSGVEPEGKPEFPYRVR